MGKEGKKLVRQLPLLTFEDRSRNIVMTPQANRFNGAGEEPNGT